VGKIAAFHRDLVVDQWTWDGESSSHRDFLFYMTSEQHQII